MKTDSNLTCGYWKHENIPPLQLQANDSQVDGLFAPIAKHVRSHAVSILVASKTNAIKTFNPLNSALPLSDKTFHKSRPLFPKAAGHNENVKASMEPTYQNIQPRHKDEEAEVFKEVESVIL